MNRIRILILGLTCSMSCAGQVAAYIPVNGDIAAHPGDTISIFGDVQNNGRFGSLNGSSVLFYGKNWQNSAISQLPDELYYGLDTTQGMGGFFRFLQLKGATNGPQYITGGFDVGGNGGPGFPNLGAGNVNGLYLQPGSDLAIRHTLHFEQGNVFLNASNLVVGQYSPGTITGYSDQQFVVTGTDVTGGFLYRRAVSSTNNMVVFPLGSAPGSYSPLALQNHASIPADFHARTFDNVYSDAVSGVINTQTDVLKTWNIGQSVLIPGDVTIWLQHDQQDEGALFPPYRDSSYVSLFSGATGNTGWDSIGPRGALNPGTLTTGSPLSDSWLNVRDFQGGLSNSTFLSVSVATTTSSLENLTFNAHRVTYHLVATDWETLGERNIAHYELQRRRQDEDSFYTVAVVPTQTPDGNSTGARTYNQSDDDYYGNWTYYRLKIVGRDSRISYSVIRKVPNFFDVVVSPNPNTGVFTVTLLGIFYPLMMEMYDMAGHRLGIYTINGSANIAVPQLPAGNYVLVFWDQTDHNSRVFTKQIIILHH